ncbi:L-carnitine dehydratase/bile acid-inducible protein F [Caballeronia calidae]|uniref:L-carnitine dehydratase/bile acid-inducible protein F n=1 Tax=Caballeronia calidae TaxID=1777139 RepID=A0A158E4C5_9BURK|nr:CoA transferase [Caballeronia calidae]SAL01688.1 L-carnitine dehydratase/bile acid-inducible protein F [Caballeronia calidae]
MADSFITPSAGFLENKVVVEIGDRTAVAACGSLLAEAGATVIVVESRNARETGKWSNRACATAGKLSIVIDKDSSRDSEILSELLESADVLLASTDDLDGSDVFFSGFDPRTIWDRPRPVKQIVCDITAYGHAGPMRGQGASEAMLQAVCGIATSTGYQEGPPVIGSVPVIEMSAGLYAASAVIAAMRVQRLHGFGQRIDMAMLDVGFMSLASQLAVHLSGRHSSRSGNRHPLFAPWNSFRTNDGYIMVCSVTNEQFARLCQAIERPELAGDARFVSVDARKRNTGALEAEIAQWTLRHTVGQCIEALSALGVACGPVVEAAALANEPNLSHRGLVGEVRDAATADGSLIPTTVMRGRPVSGISSTRVPRSGEDKDAVLRLLTKRTRLEGSGKVDGDPPSERLPLDGVRVIEIGQYTVAPLAGKHLGALGADVIKVEAPSGDPIRGGAADSDMAPIFALINTDKRSLVLDLRVDEDKVILHRLLSESDILIENLRQGALAAFGFGPDILRERYPRLVGCSVSGFGSDSVYPGRPAFDTVIQAMSGLMESAPGETVPLKQGISASDILGGQFGLLVLLAGLEYRDRTGNGVYFDVSMQDASAWASQYCWNGGGAGEAERRIVKCSDGYVLVESLDEFEDQSSRDTRAVFVKSCNERGMRAVPILEISEVVNDTQIRARELLLERSSVNSTWTVLGSPLKLRSTPPRVRHVIAGLGEDDKTIVMPLYQR